MVVRCLSGTLVTAGRCQMPGGGGLFRSPSDTRRDPLDPWAPEPRDSSFCVALLTVCQRARRPSRGTLEKSVAATSQSCRRLGTSRGSASRDLQFLDPGSEAFEIRTGGSADPCSGLGGDEIYEITHRHAHVH